MNKIYLVLFLEGKQNGQYIKNKASYKVHAFTHSQLKSVYWNNFSLIQFDDNSRAVEMVHFE